MRTPYRTPKTKSSRRVARNLTEDNQRILGTPDYLSPELLLQQEHGQLSPLLYYTIQMTSLVSALLDRFSVSMNFLLLVTGDSFATTLLIMLCL